MEVEGRRRREQVQLRQQMYVAWHAAAFQRSKRMPSWDSIDRKLGRDRPRQSQAEMLAIVRTLNVVFGGRDETQNQET